MVSNQQNLFMVFENDAKHKYPYSFKALTTLYHAGKDDRLRVTDALLTGECPEKRLIPNRIMNTSSGLLFN